ncbi:hypothetical protein [Nocardia cerradoensis]|uniref:hypothetical protein n=1 Tax=Nocardia cerradoensis TaxID=85688 RepID=UPI0012F64780|nr:hypothetical protein [Nocardia cerradoensis]
MPKRTPRLLVERTDPAVTFPTDVPAGKSSALGAPNFSAARIGADPANPRSVHRVWGLRQSKTSIKLRRIDPRPEARAPTTAMIPLITAFLSPSVPLANHVVFDVDAHVGLVRPVPAPKIVTFDRRRAPPA